jgi:GNAT superfamily N-acetyltransferase
MTIAATDITLREATPDDAHACGRVLYEAFHGVAAQRGFPDDFPNAEFATLVISFLTNEDGHFGVVAERGGEVVGSNFISERDPIRGVGPISVSPLVQGAGVGRRLMEAVIERGRTGAGIRLLQDAHNTVSMSLYALLGFKVKEPVVRLMGDGLSGAPPGFEVRPLEPTDLPACERMCLAVHGFERTGELRAAIEGPVATPIGVLRDGRLTGYATSLLRWSLAHGVAQTDEDMRALIAGGGDPVDFLLPTRQAALFRWCLDRGLRVIKPMTLMAMGGYQEPRGAWFPSAAY